MALASGVLLGFSAGLSPGPMLALVLAQTLRQSIEDFEAEVVPSCQSVGVALEPHIDGQWKQCMLRSMPSVAVMNQKKRRK
jgi:hypothetical protein